MKHILNRLLSFISFAVFAAVLGGGCTTPAGGNVLVAEPIDLVNTLMGTDSEFALSNGNTYPAVAMPWGMNFWTPQTGKMGDGWGYTYDSYRIRRGFTRYSERCC